jgi:hypothetical protein
VILNAHHPYREEIYMALLTPHPLRKGSTVYMPTKRRAVEGVVRINGNVVLDVTGEEPIYLGTADEANLLGYKYDIVETASE